MKMKDLLEARARTVAAMREIADNPEGDGGDLSDDQAKRFDTFKTDLDQVEKRIERQAIVDEADRRVNGQQVAGTGDARLDMEMRNFSLVRAIAARAGMDVDDGRERELSTEIQRRAGRTPQGFFVPLSVFHEPVEERVVTTTLPAGGPGSNIIATDLLEAQFIDRLRAALRVRQLGARVLTGLVGNVDIPRLKLSATSGWVAENTVLTASDIEVDKIAVTPKHAGALVEFSRNMLMQTSPDIEQLVRRDFAAILAEAVDDVAIEGGGTDEPTGVLATAGIGDVPVGTNGGPITWNLVIDLIAEVEIDNAEGSAFMTNSKVVKSARKTAKVTATDSVMIMEGPQELAGFPVANTNLVPSDLTKGTGSNLSALLFGNWGDLILAFWSELDVLVNPFETTAFKKGNVQVRGMLTMDVAVRHPESFAAIKDIDTT